MPDVVPKASVAPMANAAFSGFRRRLRAAETAESRGEPGDGLPKRSGTRETDQQSALSHLIQGGVLVGVLVLLFFLAGFRG